MSEIASLDPYGVKVTRASLDAVTSLHAVNAIAAMKLVTSVIDSLLFFIFNSPFSNNSANIINILFF
jgi:hypothetical protein